MARPRTLLQTRLAGRCRNRRTGVTVLLVEQSAFRTLEQADRAYVMREGRMVAQGTAPMLLAEEDFLRRYIAI